MEDIKKIVNTERQEGMMNGIDRVITILEKSIQQYAEFETDEVNPLIKRVYAEQRRKGVEKTLEEIKDEKASWEKMFKNHKRKQGVQKDEEN